MNKWVCYIAKNGIESVKKGECIVFDSEYQANEFCNNHKDCSYVDFKFMWSDVTLSDICKIVRTTEKGLSAEAKEDFIKIYDLCKYIQHEVGDETFSELAQLLNNEWELEFALMVTNIADRDIKKDHK